MSASRTADLTWLERELVSGRASLERLTGSPRIFDVDDAIWLLSKPGRDFTLKIASACRLVIAGNEAIRRHFHRAGVPAETVETAIDTDRWHPREADTGRALVIGWTGSSSTLLHLELITTALATFLREDMSRRLLVLCDRPPALPGVDRAQIDYRPWSAHTEACSVREMDIGIMPQPDDPWTQGKCSFKMLQYMATGIPTICSPVGHARELLSLDRVGIAAEEPASWHTALSELAYSPERRQELGAEARRVAVKHFSLPVISARLARAFREALT